MTNSGIVSLEVFESVMHRKVGMHYPVTKVVLRQYFNAEKESGSKESINYKKLGANALMKKDKEP